MAIVHRNTNSYHYQVISRCPEQCYWILKHLSSYTFVFSTCWCALQSIFLTQTSASVTLSRKVTMTMNEFISKLQHIMIYNTQITYLMWLTRNRGGKLEDHCSSCCLPSGPMYLSYSRDMVVQPSPIVSHICDSNSDLNLQLVVFNCGLTVLLYYRKMLLLVLVYHICHYL